MYYIAICDDDSLFIQYLKKMILKSGLNDSEVSFYEYSSGEELIGALNELTKIDLLFLDMQMKELDGHSTAKHFRKEFPCSLLVFCSGVCMPTVESFEVTPFRYILKAYTDSKIIHELKSVVCELKARRVEPYIMGIWHYNTVKLKLDEILYIAIARNGSRIYMRPDIPQYDFEQYITSRKKVDELYKLLKDYGFEYAHNSYIVNLRYIKRKTVKELELTDGTKLSIARSKEKALRVALAKSMAKKY